VRFIDFTYLPDWLFRNDLMGPILQFFDGGMFLVQARSESMSDGTVASCAPEAVGQAIAWAKLTKLDVTIVLLRVVVLKLFQTKGSAFLSLERGDLDILHPDIGRRPVDVLSIEPTRASPKVFANV